MMIMEQFAFDGDVSSWDVGNVTELWRHVLQLRQLQRRPLQLGCQQRDKFQCHVCSKQTALIKISDSGS